MVADVHLTGVDGFLRLSKALRGAGSGAMRKELNKRLKAAVVPVTPKTRAQAAAVLPQRGGLAKRVAKAPQRIQVRTGSTTAGVRLVVGNNGSAARGTNRGEFRHPVFWRPPLVPRFVAQKVTPGWFDTPAEAALPGIREAAERAMQSIVDDIVRGAKL